jgi:hypothetical protein
MGYAVKNDGSAWRAVEDASWCAADETYATVQPPPYPASIALPQAQAAQIALLTADYQAAISQPVAYMSTTFQADPDSQMLLNKVLTALTPTGAVPSGFGWLDAGNNLVAMTLAQLQGLAAAMMTQGWAAFQHLQTLKAEVRAATTVSQVQAIVW